MSAKLFQTGEIDSVFYIPTWDHPVFPIISAIKLASVSTQAKVENQKKNEQSSSKKTFARAAK
jgi:hypothetical protein